MIIINGILQSIDEVTTLTADTARVKTIGVVIVMLAVEQNAQDAVANTTVSCSSVLDSIAEIIVSCRQVTSF